MQRVFDIVNFKGETIITSNRYTNFLLWHITFSD